MFLDNLLLVSQQAGVLIILMVAGALLYKVKAITDTGVSEMSTVLFWAVTPCLLIEAFSREFDMQVAKQLLIFALLAALTMVAALAVFLLVFRRSPENERGIMAFGAAFSNCGFMGLPMANAVYGAEGVMYASVFVAVFNILQWTWGYRVLSGRGVSVKKMILNPGVIGIALSLPIFIFSVKLPALVIRPVEYLAGINTPLAMIVVGAQLARSDLLKALASGRVYAVSALRLIVVPAAVMAALYFLPSGLQTLPVKVLIIEAAAPVAANTAIISQQAGNSNPLSGQTVALSTLASAVTMPVFATVAEMLFR